MHVLLIQPGKRKGFAAPFGHVEPLGLESVAGAIRGVCDVDFIDLRFASLSDLQDIIASERIDACGITSSFTLDYNQVRRAAEIVKQIDPGVFVFVGGHHPSMRPQDFCLPSIDAVVIGEGEITTKELIETLSAGGDLRKVCGLALRCGDGQFLTSGRPLIHDLDSLPRHDSTIVDRFRNRYRLFRERYVTSLESIRGCQFRCNFCSVWKFYQGKVRMKSPERVIDEIKNVSTENVFFVDDNFFASPRRAEKIADMIKLEGIKKGYLVQARTDAIASHPEIMDKWAEVGMRFAFVGFEKIGQADLDAVEKQNSVENNERALEVLRDRGIEPVVSFIVDPDFGEDEFSELRNYVKKLSMRMPYFTMLTPLPGTELYDNNREKIVNNDYDFFDLLHPVLPTKLSVNDFALRFSELYKSAYPISEAFAGAILIFVDVLKGKLAYSDWREIVRDWQTVTNPKKYLVGFPESVCEA